MNELAIYLKKMLVFVLSLVCVCFILAILMPRIEHIFLGVALGTGVSCVNAFYLSFKVRAVTTAISEGKTKRMGMGFITRVFLAILAIFIAVKFPDYFNLYAVAFGLVVAQFSLLIIGIYVSSRKKLD